MFPRSTSSVFPEIKFYFFDEALSYLLDLQFFNEYFFFRMLNKPLFMGWILNMLQILYV